MHFLLQKPLLAHLPNIRLLVAASNHQNKLDLESIFQLEDEQIVVEEKKEP